jgi:hypothetical protein
LTFLTMMWANSRNCHPIPANQMQLLWHHLAFIQNPPPFCCSLPPPPPMQVLCVSHRELKNRALYMQLHGVLGMKGFVQATWSNYIISRTCTKDSIPFENFIISSLQAIISLSKVCLKPENHTSKMGWILVKKYLILILFTLFRILMKN